MRTLGSVHEAGVRAPRVHVLVDLDVDTEQEAAAFLALLRTRIWSSPTSSPALVGDPVTRVLSVQVDSSAA